VSSRTDLPKCTYSGQPETRLVACDYRVVVDDKNCCCKSAYCLYKVVGKDMKNCFNCKNGDTNRGGFRICRLKKIDFCASSPSVPDKTRKSLPDMYVKGDVEK